MEPRTRIFLTPFSSFSIVNFEQVNVSWVYSFSLEAESTSHFLLLCQNFTDPRKCLMNELIKSDSCILTLDGKSFTKLLIYGDGTFDNKRNTSIILASLKETFWWTITAINWCKKRNICFRCLDFNVCFNYINKPDGRPCLNIS